MQAVNPAKYIGRPTGYPTSSNMAPDKSGMPTIRPANYDAGCKVFPDIPNTWKLTKDAYKATVDQLTALTPIADLFPVQVASLKQLLARHDAYLKMESDECEMQVPRIRAASMVTEAIRAAQANGISWQGALDDFLAAISGAAGQ